MTLKPFCCCSCGQTWTAEMEGTRCEACGTLGDHVVGVEWSEAEHVMMRAWIKPRVACGWKWVQDFDMPSVPFHWRAGVPSAGMLPLGLVRRSDCVEVMDLERCLLVGDPASLEEALVLVEAWCIAAELY